MVFGTYGETPLKIDRLQGVSLAIALAAFVGVSLAAVAGVAWNSFGPSVPNGLIAPSAPSKQIVDPFLLVCAIGSAAFSWYIFKARVTVWPDRIESTNGFFTRTLLRSDIAGYRHRSNGTGITLIPRDEFSKPMNVSGKLVHDPATAKWFEGLPDLDAQEFQAASEALQKDDRLGSTAAERERRLQMWGRIGSIANPAGYALGFWALLWPHPYDIPIIASMLAVPVAIALHVASRAVLGLAQPRNDPRPSVQGLFFLPGIAVGFHALTAFNLLDWTPEVIWAGGFAFALSAAILLRDEVIKANLSSALFVPVVLFAFAYGSIVELNAAFDRSTPRIFPVDVVNKHVSSGKSTTYYLDLAARDDRRAAETRVDYDFYRSVSIGETVCVHLRTGWLGYRYYYVRHCGLSGAFLPRARARGRNESRRFDIDFGERDCVLVNPGTRSTTTWKST